MATKQQLVITIRIALLAAAVLQAAAAITIEKYHEATIHVTNKLSSKAALIVHCRSKDDDLGARALDAEASYSLRFSQNVFGRTLFWCKAAVQDKRLSFTAFDEDDHSTYVKDFDVSDDGVDGVDTYSGERIHVCKWN